MGLTEECDVWKFEDYSQVKTQISEPQNRCLINVDYLYFNLDHSSNSLDEDAMIFDCY